MTNSTHWTLAERAAKMNPSVIREILKVTEKPGIISFAGGLPSSKTFPVAEFEAACAKVLKDDPAGALQYAASEGYGPLRELVAAQLKAQSAAAGVTWNVDPAQVLITTGSQQGLDLVAKILIDKDSKVLVESPTYLGAVMAFTPMEPNVVSVASDAEGIDIADLAAKSADARFLYVLPNFQNPTGRSMTEARRAALSAEAARSGLPIMEDNPYGDLWFDQAPPAPLTARNPEGGIYLGSFSKVLAPGLRMGFIVAPKAVYPKLLQAKQAADLHSPGFNQRLIFEVMQNGFLDRHVPTIRSLYKAQRDAMLEALAKHFPESKGPDSANADSTFTWNTPAGGMFLWARLPAGMNAVDLLPHAVDKGVAFVPGAPFYAGNADARAMRLSFVTPSVEEIHRGVAALAEAIHAQRS
ncbi:PLP-dependent aminotransferase family protein [Rhodoferax sp. TBRC 17660]|uniref:PLP-dependent aminotransferase family protein n=1 Tax=Rhodoferax potami TaxID=3068338 RepID=A0ABU3KLQ4_9BURK|nr:PLP-dependent aminotransferase family protein [Rhodoferax sp. TBRC 17660]MDT7518451.1 PLP-dependent aminotransferase family protein [Rhodoferax sp. TBRC 17660]